MKLFKDTSNLSDDNKLDSHELEFLLNTLRTCTVRGDSVELFCKIAIKLQNQFTKLTGKQ